MNNRSMCRKVTVFAVFTLLIISPIVPLSFGLNILTQRNGLVDLGDNKYNYFVPEESNTNQETLINDPYHNIRKVSDMSEQLQFGKPNLGKGCDGYILFAPWLYTKTYLIDNKWKVVHKWNSRYMPGMSVYLLENGNLLRADYAPHPGIVWGQGDTGRVEMFSSDGTQLWNYVYANDTVCLHHDIEPLPNGNVLMVAWEVKTKDEAIAAGCKPSAIPEDIVWVDHIIEVKPIGPESGDIVWEWHVWDHLIQDYDPSKDNYGVVADHPELIDINFMAISAGKDWNHINAIDYNEEFDQILLTSAGQNEIWVIDHSTITEEAAGHTCGTSGKGGDLLYRWGNPWAYQAGTSGDKKFFFHHDARWVEPGYPGEGHITIFHNGYHRPGEDYSSVLEIVPPVDSIGTYYLEPGSAYGPEDPIWEYTAKNPPDFFAIGQSGAQRLPNGNTLICHGPRGVFFEVTPDKKIVWLYANLFGGRGVFKINFYPPDYPGIQKVSYNQQNTYPLYTVGFQWLQQTFPLLARILNLFIGPLG